jgi:hypothetical protein
MKQWHIITIALLVLAFLAFNAIRQNVNRVSKDRKWFVSHLHYKFSGTVDSVRRIGPGKGIIVLHTKDSIDETLENFLNQKVKEHMRFLVFMPTGKISIFSPVGGKAMVGDSVFIDSEADHIYLFRNGEKVTESVISTYLRGKPF